MPEKMTIEKATELREQQIEHNRSQGVIEWSNGLPQSDKVVEVVEGCHRLPQSDGKGKNPGWLTLGPGNRFRPTESQIRSGALKGKVRDLTADEYRSVTRSRDSGRKVQVQGADIGLRAIHMADSTRQYARDEGLTEDDFKGQEPDGTDGRFTRAFVEAMVAQKVAAEA